MPSQIKFGHNTENLKVNRFLPNLIIKFNLCVEPLQCWCRTKLIFIWFGAARPRARSMNREDQNTGGALLEFPMRTAMHAFRLQHLFAIIKFQIWFLLLLTWMK